MIFIHEENAAVDYCPVYKFPAWEHEKMPFCWALINSRGVTGRQVFTLFLIAGPVRLMTDHRPLVAWLSFAVCEQYTPAPSQALEVGLPEFQ